MSQNPKRSEYKKDPPKTLSRDLLLRTLVWRIQESAFGGHDHTTVKLLNGYARGKGNDPIFRRLKAGTVLVREYQGTRHTVTISANGFIWEGRSYQSLIASRADCGAGLK